MRKKYFKKDRKVWFSDLGGYNKHLDHNSFAVLTQECNKKETGSMDVKTKNLVNMTGNCNHSHKKRNSLETA